MGYSMYQTYRNNLNNPLGLVWCEDREVNKINIIAESKAPEPIYREKMTHIHIIFNIMHDRLANTIFQSK